MVMTRGMDNNSITYGLPAGFSNNKETSLILNKISFFYSTRPTLDQKMKDELVFVASFP